jgi:periplasmic mercuric ion binding protein
MKTIKMIVVAIIALVASVGASAQSHDMSKMNAAKTVSFKVYGNCETCKSRIEGALKVDGVSKAVWDVKTKMLTVTFNPAKISVEKLHAKVAAVGHDTDKVKADSKVYAKLPACCQYVRRK